MGPGSGKGGSTVAVVPMKRICIYGLRRDRKAILEALQRAGAVEVCRAEYPSSEEGEEKPFGRMDTSSSIGIFRKGLQDIEEALQILDRHAPEKGSFLGFLKGRREIGEKEYYDLAARWEEILRCAGRIQALEREITEAEGELRRLSARREALSPWAGLDIPMRFQGTRRTAAFIGSLSGEYTARELEAALSERSPGLEASIETVSSTKEMTCIFALCPKGQGEQMEAALRELGASRPSSPGKKPPVQEAEELREREAALSEENSRREEELSALSAHREDLKFAEDYLSMRMEKYQVISRLLQSKRAFVLEGYVPAGDAEGLAQKICRRYSAEAELAEPSGSEDVPVLLENNAFAAPVEGVLESFSMPGKGEIDPSPVMAVFYYIFFGMMLSDAAYGVIMAAACAFCLRKFRNMEDSMRKSLRMFFFCGLSTVFWGFMYGSFFGDAVSVFSKTFLGKEYTLPALWFTPIDEPMRMLMFCLLFGIVHLFAGLFLNGVQLWRQKRYKDVLYDVVFWYLLVGGLVVLLMSTDMFADIAQMEKLGGPAGSAAAVAAAIGAAGILLTGGRESRNPVKRLLKGAYSLYNVTGYLGDILSYSRLLALGLATGVIAEVINSMAVMAGGGVSGLIVFILVFLVGHTINIGINLLGAYVHTNRLQFVEFFGKFFEGGGRKFSPFGVHTKYIKIREDT